MGFWRGQSGCLHLYPSSLRSPMSYHHRIRWHYRPSAFPPFDSRFGSKAAVPPKRNPNQESTRSARPKSSCISPIRFTASYLQPTHSFKAFLASECPHRDVAEEFASDQMLHLHPQRRVAPLHVTHPRTLEHLPRSGETL